ncbi:hypothetical protein JYU16_01485, partial [bacterium AH-315-M05]|nr:hypothetical protein [bacterium AH-315-M05]
MAKLEVVQAQREAEAAKAKAEAEKSAAEKAKLEAAQAQREAEVAKVQQEAETSQEVPKAMKSTTVSSVESKELDIYSLEAYVPPKPFNLKDLEHKAKEVPETIVSPPAKSEEPATKPL